MIKKVIISIIIILLLITSFYYISKTITKHTGYVTANTVKQTNSEEECNQEESQENNLNKINCNKGG